MATLTVGLPFTAVDDNLFAAIESVRKQDYKDWELILHGDGVAPVVLDELADSLSSDRRIEVRGSSTRLGLASTLNDIAHRANTEYLFRMDSDDVMFRNRLSEQLATLRKNDADDVVVSGGAIVIDECNRVYGPLRIDRYVGDINQLLGSSVVVHPTVAARTEWFLRNPYNSDFERAQDKELWLRSAPHTNLIVDPRPMIFYRITGQASKFGKSSYYNRKILMRYGPQLVGYAHTGVLVGRELALSSRVPFRRLRFSKSGTESIERRCSAMDSSTVEAFKAQLDDIVSRDNRLNVFQEEF